MQASSNMTRDEEEKTIICANTDKPTEENNTTAQHSDENTSSTSEILDENPQAITHVAMDTSPVVQDGTGTEASTEASISEILQASHYAVIDGMVDIVVKKIKRKQRRRYHKIVMVTDLKVERGTADGKEFQKALKLAIKDNLIREFGELYTLDKVSIKKKKSEDFRNN